MTHPDDSPPTVRDCLRNVLRRNGCAVPPTPESIAAPLTDDELAWLIYGLEVIWHARRCGAT